MKKLITIIASLTILSCETSHPTKVTYVVFYPNYNDTIIVTMDDRPYVGSDRGTNYLKSNNMTGSTVYQGSSPLKIISWYYIKK